MRETVRAESYRFLAECYYPPDAELLETLNGFEEPAAELYSEVIEHLPGEDELESLMVDHARLFLGPFQLLAPPYGSVYLENAKRIMGESTVEVRNRYAEEGLEVARKEVADHITVELEFMYFLVVKEVEALRGSDSNRAGAYVQKQQEFLEKYLGCWIREFVARIEKSATTDFYKKLGEITMAFVQKDRAYLSTRRPEAAARSETLERRCWRSPQLDHSGQGQRTVPLQ